MSDGHGLDDILLVHHPELLSRILYRHPCRDTQSDRLASSKFTSRIYSFVPWCNDRMSFRVILIFACNFNAFCPVVGATIMEKKKKKKKLFCDFQVVEDNRKTAMEM